MLNPPIGVQYDVLSLFTVIIKAVTLNLFQGLFLTLFQIQRFLTPEYGDSK